MQVSSKLRVNAGILPLWINLMLHFMAGPISSQLQPLTAPPPPASQKLNLRIFICIYFAPRNRLLEHFWAVSY
jgi:hypothetical protein